MASTHTSGPVSVVADVRGGDYGSKITAVEPGGAEFIPLADRHGKPISLFWTWMSPNLEFATIFLGVLAVAAFGLGFWPAVLAIVLGSGLGGLTQGFLSARGPELGVAQMVASRIPFGFRGNILPAGLNATIASIGWFAVNSVSGALALNALTSLPKVPSLLVVVAAQIGIAFLGHNFIHAFERLALPLLAVAFTLAYVVTLSKADLSAIVPFGTTPPADPEAAAFWVHPVAGFTLMFATSFGYAAGWNPYATDYTRYFAPETSKKAIALWAGLGVFVSCSVLEILGVLAMTLPTTDPFGNPAGAFVSNLPTFIAKLVLLAIAVGAVSANAINVYSGAMSFLALGIRMQLGRARAIVAAVAGVLGTLVALLAIDNVSSYEGFLLVIAYWIGPWLGVYLTDQYLRRGHQVSGYLFDRTHNPYAGWVSMLVATAVSIWLFSNQQKYVGVMPKQFDWMGDLTFEVGFVLAAALYVVLFRLQKPEQDEVLVLPDAK